MRCATPNRACALNQTASAEPDFELASDPRSGRSDLDCLHTELRRQAVEVLEGLRGGEPPPPSPERSRPVVWPLVTDRLCAFGRGGKNAAAIRVNLNRNACQRRNGSKARGPMRIAIPARCQQGSQAPLPGLRWRIRQGTLGLTSFKPPQASLASFRTEAARLIITL
jgi:hypothetical protein